jgi:hypothetical protein
LTLFLLHLLRDQIISSTAEAAIDGVRERNARPGAPVVRAPAYALDDDKIRALIDEGFVYLTASQRDEVYASVKRALADPRNVNLRPMIVQQLALKASAVRQAHERLANLSYAEKKKIAEEARAEYDRLGPDERHQMVRVLQSGIAPIPRDLNEMILAEFSNAPSTATKPQ